jgi:hypothetical protein
MTENPASLHERNRRAMFLLISAELRDSWRWALQHLYVLLILGPLVIGMTWLTVINSSSYISDFQAPSLVAQILVALAFPIALITLNLSRASESLYHLRQPSTFAEALPVKPVAHLNLTVLTRLWRTCIIGVSLFFARYLFSTTSSVTGAEILCLIVLVLLLSVAEVYAALNWIHWNHTHERSDAAKACLIVLIAAGVAGLCLLAFMNPEGTREFAGLVTLRRSSRTLTSSVMVLGSAVTALIYFLMRRAHDDWRGLDIDYTQRLRQGSRWSLSNTVLLRRRFSPRVAAMLARDLQLTLRSFSSVVYVASALSILSILLMFILLTGGVLTSAKDFLPGKPGLGWASATWLPSSLAIKLTCVLAVASTSSIVPLLVHYQLPHMWLERAAGATGKSVWETKLWFTRLATLPVVLAVCFISIPVILAGAQVPASYVVPLILECVWIWWLVSTAAGALAFEMPDRPELAMVVILSVSVSVGALSAILWVMGLGLYGMTIDQLRLRGAARASSYLASETQ